MIYNDSDSMVADIAIVGGGPSGLVLAAVCERLGLDYVVYERSAKETTPRGGCLDLHHGSGQRAMREAGVYAEFQKHARGGSSSVHAVFDHHCNQVFSWGEGRDSPEIDRHEIKAALLTGIPNGKIEWRKGVESASRDEFGYIILKFVDGSTVTGFKLVVGADGTFSKVRPLITLSEPRYWGVVFVYGPIRKTNAFWQKLYNKGGEGPMVVLGRQTKIWIQLQGTGEYRVECGIMRPADFGQNGRPVNLDDSEAVKKLLCSEDFFGQHAQFIQDMINAVEGPCRAWPLREMPVEALNWEPSADVTLIGDAAHTTTPFVGDGANCAMRDAVLLAHQIKDRGIGREAIAAYEQEMFGFAREMITNSNMSGKLFFAPDAPASFIAEMKAYAFIGKTDTV